MTLEPIEILNGTFSILCVVISSIVGLIIISKYFKYKQRVLVLFGISWIGLFSPWWPSSISFLLALNTGQGLSAPVYFFIGNFLAPIIMLIWISGFTEFIFKKQRKIIFIIYLVIGILFEIFFLYLILTDPRSIGELSGILDVTYKGIVLYYAIFLVANVFITGILFAKETLKSTNPEYKLKGYFLLLAFISWSLGAIMDAALPLNPLSLIVARLILISSAIEFYLGFILPNFVKNVFIKKD